MRYEIKGTPFPVVEVSLEAGETMLSDAGAMAYMDDGMVMETTSNGGL